MGSGGGVAGVVVVVVVFVVVVAVVRCVFVYRQAMSIATKPGRPGGGGYEGSLAKPGEGRGSSLSGGSGLCGLRFPDSGPPVGSGLGRYTCQKLRGLRKLV